MTVKMVNKRFSPGKHDCIFRLLMCFPVMFCFEISRKILKKENKKIS